MKINNNQKGFSLIEVVITIAILGVITSVIYSVFQFGIDSYYSGSSYSSQQNKVVDAVQFFRSQVEESKSVKYYISDDGSEEALLLSNNHLGGDEMVNLYTAAISGTPTNDIKAWKFESDTLMHMGWGATSYKNIVENLDISGSGFFYNNARIVMKVKPENLNKKYKNRNILKPITTEISIRYKLAE